MSQTKLKHIVGATGLAMCVGWALRGVAELFITDRFTLFLLGTTAISSALFIQAIILKGVYGDKLS